MLVEDLAAIIATAVIVLGTIIGGIIYLRWQQAKLHPPLTTEETELQLEEELEKVNKQIESLQAEED